MMENHNGTAGAPILKLILEKGLSNILVVVTRYFGGVLLGTGGLVRAYSGATEKALEKATIVEKSKGYEAKIVIDYNYLEPLKYYLKKMEINIIKIDYLEQIEIIIEVLEEKSNLLTNNYNNCNFNNVYWICCNKYNINNKWKRKSK